MKVLPVLLAVCSASLSISLAKPSDPFVAPSFVKELTDLEEVIKTATEANKGVTFLLMEPGST